MVIIKSPATAKFFGLGAIPATMFCMDLVQFLEFSYQTLVGRGSAAGSCSHPVFGSPDQAKSRAGAFSDRRAGTHLGCLRLAPGLELYEAITFQKSPTKIPTYQVTKVCFTFGPFWSFFGHFWSFGCGFL